MGLNGKVLSVSYESIGFNVIGLGLPSGMHEKLRLGSAEFESGKSQVSVSVVFKNELGVIGMWH